MDQQKDLLAFLFPDSSSSSDQNHRQHDQQLSSHRTPNALQNFPPSSNPSLAQQQLDLVAVSNMISLHGLDSSSSALPSPAALTPQMLLDQQYKLTQLHQLQQLQNQIQNQIFQQQLALISGQTPLATHETNSDPPRDPIPPFNGLPTPLSSAEIRPSNPEFLSRLNPSFQNSQPPMHASHAIETIPLPSPQEPSASNQYMRHPGSLSAPANIAFQSFPSPSDLDISPLASPWLEAYPHPPSFGPAKRTASPSGDDTTHAPPRKRPTPAVSASTKVPRSVKSANNTPLLRSTRARRDSFVNETDSPSPVDLSMPPPAPPKNPTSPSNYVPTTTATLPIQEELRMTPVTPASIMNLGRLGVSSGFAPVVKSPRTDKGKEPAKTKEAPKASRKGGLPLISPGPKPILPARSATSPNSSSAVSPPAPVTRKSHKDAEQKRRDSLKSAYDDLRVLLPPIPMPSDDNFPDEPILPGALPPRGPPKAGGDGPNKGVSKLQLLRCGNDFIRTLKGRVERRDTEIASLRREVLRLRAFAGEESHEGDVDLERDLDAVEAGHPKMGLSVLEEEGDDGEDV